MKRDFKGVWIPKEIWLSKELTLQEKVFLAEIDSLDNENGCYASNNYFAKFFKLSRNRCSEIIKSLEKKGLVLIEYIRQDGKANIEKRVIRVVDKPNTPIRESEQPIRKVEEGCSEKWEDNNTSINNTINNTDIYIRSIFDYWNSKEIIKHRELTQKRKSAINARLKSYSIEELKQAIDNYAEILKNDKYYWTHDWTLEQFMNPSNVERFINESNPFYQFLDKSKKRKNNYVPMAQRYDPKRDAF